MAKLTESKIFYIQAFTILALVCLPGNIFTAVMLYIQHFSSVQTTGESLPTTGPNSTQLYTGNENQSEAMFENETLFSSVNLVAKSQELIEGPRPSSLPFETSEKTSMSSTTSTTSTSSHFVNPATMTDGILTTIHKRLPLRSESQLAASSFCIKFLHCGASLKSLRWLMESR